MNTTDKLQWTGCALIIAGHSLNAMGPAAYPYNLLVFTVGTVVFLTWACMVKNSPQIVVNAVSILIGLVGLIKALG